jgi:predicted transcriptional regulator
VEKTVDKLLECRECRPRRLKSLSAFIHAQLNHEASETTVQTVITKLTDRGLVIQPDGKLIYPTESNDQ